MVQFHKLVDDAEARKSGVGPQLEIGVEQMKPSLNSVITFAYVHYQLMKGLAPCIQENAEDGTLISITKLAKHFSKHMQLVLPRLQDPPPAQMLRFTNKIPAEIFTNRIIDLQVELLDIESGKICTGALASTLKVKIFVVRGNFRSDDQKLRTCKPLCPRNKATMPLLVQAASKKPARKGQFEKNFVVKLCSGKAVVKVKITDNSSWVRCGTFKLVAQAVKGSDQQGRRIKEALSNSFAVKESKLEGRRKHAVPSPTDKTWRLINVGKEYAERLQSIGINNVQDFLNKLDSDPDELKRTLGMQNMKWESTVEHARKCRVTQDIEVNVSNSRGNGTDDSITSNLGVQQGNMEGTTLIGMLSVEHVVTCVLDTSVSNSRGNITIPEPLLNVPVLNDGFLHAQEIQGMTMNNYASWNPDNGPPFSIDDFLAIENPGLELGNLPNPLTELQPENMGMDEQVVFVSNTSFDEPGGSDYSNWSEFYNFGNSGMEQ